MGLENPYFGFRKDRAKTYSLWEKFNVGLLDPESLSESYQRLLVKEWHRCADLRIDSCKKLSVRLSEDELRARLEGRRQFLDSARAAIARVADSLVDMPGILVVADEGGVILDIFGDNEIRVLAAERTGIVEGSCWLESVAGTNGLGTAISKRQPVHVYASEHYCEGWHAWTCAAMPVITSGGEDICGVINFTATNKDYRDQALALSRSLADSIQADLCLDQRLERDFLVQQFHKFRARYPADLVVAIDSRGRQVRRSSGVPGGHDAWGTARLEGARERIDLLMPASGHAAGSIYILEPVARKRSIAPPQAAAPPATSPSAAVAEPGEDMLADYRLIFDNSIVGICYTRDRLLIQCNRRLEEMLGYGPGELSGQSARICYPSADAYERVERGYEYLRKHASYSDERKDGSLFWCNVSGKTLDPGNPRHSAIWIFQDISEQKKAEEELQRTNDRLEQRIQERTAELRKANDSLRAEIERRRVAEQALEASREKYRVLFETFPIGISITDEQGEVIEINQAMRRNIPQATLAREMEVAGAVVIRADGSPIARDQLPGMQALREQRAVHDVELGVRHLNHKVRWFNATAAPIPVKGYGVAIAHTEITARKRIEEQERQQRADLARVSRLNTMGEMAAALAHELGQPLSSALNYLHGCQLRLAAGERDVELLQTGISRAISDTERAGDIVRHIRQFVRRHEPETVLTDLNALIREMVAFLDFERRECEAQILLTLEQAVPALPLDPLEIKQVVVNLVKNGLEAAADLPGPRRLLEISTRIAGPKWVEVAVADRGHGIDKADSPRLFDAFYSTKNNGLGLGLAICRSIVESHGGRLSAGNNEYGGATFTFRLPRSRPKP